MKAYGIPSELLSRKNIPVPSDLPYPEIGDTALLFTPNGAGTFATYTGDTCFTLTPSDPKAVADALYDYLAEYFENTPTFESLVDDTLEIGPKAALKRYTPRCRAVLFTLIPHAPSKTLDEFSHYIVDNCVTAV